MGEFKMYGGVILLHFHYFTSLEMSNTQKSEVFLLRIYSGNVNVSVITGQYPKKFTKKIPLEKLHF